MWTVEVDHGGVDPIEEMKMLRQLRKLFKVCEKRTWECIKCCNRRDATP